MRQTHAHGTITRDSHAAFLVTPCPHVHTAHHWSPTPSHPATTCHITVQPPATLPCVWCCRAGSPRACSPGARTSWPRACLSAAVGPQWHACGSVKRQQHGAVRLGLRRAHARHARALCACNLTARIDSPCHHDRTCRAVDEAVREAVVVSSVAKPELADAAAVALAGRHRPALEAAHQLGQPHLVVRVQACGVNAAISMPRENHGSSVATDAGSLASRHAPRTRPPALPCTSRDAAEPGCVTSAARRSAVEKNASSLRDRPPPAPARCMCAM